MTPEETKQAAIQLLKSSTEDQALAFGALQRVARNGDGDAATKVAVCFYLGVGCMQNYRAAVLHARKQIGTEGSAPLAQYIYGTCLLYGRGIEQNVEQAAIFLESSSHVGFRLSTFQLAGCYASGRGVPQNMIKARYLLHEAARAGDRAAMSHLGQMCMEGIGGPSDNTQAVFWLQKAANAGDPIGMQNLGFCFERGIGVIKDLQKAQQMYEGAAEWGYIPAMSALAALFLRYPDLPEADMKYRFWLTSAVDTDDEHMDAIVNNSPRKVQLDNEARFTLEKMHEYNELIKFITQ